MKLSTTWIKNSLGRTISDRELCDAMEYAGIEVEQLSSSKDIDKKIIVGKVKKCVQHSNADRLRVCEVELSSGFVQIICGAPNVRSGMTVAVAQVGANLPNGDVISKAKLRGEVSEGMLCSGLELGLNDDHDGLIELDDNLNVGMPIADIFPSDGQIEFKTAANRPDLQSTVGIANEIAAVLNIPLDQPATSELHTIQIGSHLGEIETPLTSKIIIAEIELGEENSKALSKYLPWLHTSMIRSISPIVDITNISMLEYGQPLHAYDADKIKGAISVRLAKNGESLVTLDGVLRRLSPEDLVIVDDRGPIALGGVMGGLETEITSNTKRIFIEAATFDGATVRKTSKRHGLRSEASSRFERGLPTQMAEKSLGRTITLLQESYNARVVSLSKLGTDDLAADSILLPLARLNRLTGTAMTLAETKSALERLQYAVSTSEDVITATPPWWRPDVSIAEDLIEDVVRMIGYDRIPATLPEWKPKTIRFDDKRSWRRLICDTLSGTGLFEVHTYSFVSREQIELLGEEPDIHLNLENPLSQEQSYLRRSLLPSLMQVLVKNEGYAPGYGLYELSKVFEVTKNGELPKEPERLAVIWQGHSDAFAMVKGILDKLLSALQIDTTIAVNPTPLFAFGRSGSVMLSGVEIGKIGQLAPALVRAHRLSGEIAYIELDLPAMLVAAKYYDYEAPSRFPVARRDLAIIVDRSVTWEQVKLLVSSTGDAKVSFLNDYYGTDLPSTSKSLAMRLTMSSLDHTLTEIEVADRMERIETVLAREFKAEVR